MEEDIKIIEEMKFWEGCETTIDEKWCKAIENLLQENKTSKETINILTNKLEKVVEDNNELRKYYASRKEVEDLKETIACLHESSKEMFIPISVIQNKIDELEHEKFKRTQLGVFLLKNFENQRLLAKIEVLQQLLEERNK